MRQVLRDWGAASMTEWSTRPLGQLMHLDIHTEVVDPEATYPIVGVLNRGRGLLRREAIAGSQTKYVTLNRVRPGQVVYSRLKAFEGAITVATDLLSHNYASQEFPTFTCGPDLLPRYFRLVTTLESFWDDLRAKSKGMGGRRERVKPGDFLDLLVAVPPLEAQRRIVDLIGALDVQIEALRGEHDAAQEVLTCLREDSLSPQDGWTKTKLGEITSFAPGYSFSTGLQGKRAGAFPFIKVSEMNSPGSERVISTAANWVDRDDLRALKAKTWPPGTVIFPKVGAALLTEKRRMLGVEASFDNNVLGLVAGPRLLPDFLFALMSQIRLGQYAQQGAVPSINHGHVRQIDVLVPSLDEQRRIVDLIGAVDTQVQALAAEVGALRQSRVALLTSLLSQEIAIPESYDRVLRGG